MGDRALTTRSRSSEGHDLPRDDQREHDLNDDDSGHSSHSSRSSLEEIDDWHTRSYKALLREIIEARRAAKDVSYVTLQDWEQTCGPGEITGDMCTRWLRRMVFKPFLQEGHLTDSEIEAEEISMPKQRTAFIAWSNYVQHAHRQGTN